jgi:hypothetical protein
MTQLTVEQKCILDDMLRRRVESLSKADADEVQDISDLVAKGIMDPAKLRNIKTPGEIEAEALRQFLVATHIHDQKEDDLMIVSPDGTKVAARAIRVWASFYSTPGVKQ